MTRSAEQALGADSPRAPSLLSCVGESPKTHADPMIAIIDYLIRAAFILFVPLVIVDFFVLDRLLRWEYINARKEWIADGRPHGYFWVPPESKALSGLLVSLRSSRALRRITFEWLFKTPEWMLKLDRARLLLWLHRMLVFAIYLPMIFLLVLAVFQ